MPELDCIQCRERPDCLVLSGPGCKDRPLCTKKFRSRFIKDIQASIDTAPDSGWKGHRLVKGIGSGIQRQGQVGRKTTALNRQRQPVPRSGEFDETRRHVAAFWDTEVQAESNRLICCNNARRIGVEFGDGQIADRGTAIGEGGKGHRH